MRRRLPLWLGSMAVTLGLALLYLGAGDRPFFAKLEGPTLTWRFQLRGPVEPGPETLLVTLDDKSLAGLGRWPLPRRFLAEAVEKLDDLGAKVIVLDLLLIGAEEEAPGTPQLLEVAAGIDRLVLPYAFDYGESDASGGAAPAPLPETIRRTAFPLVRVHAFAFAGTALQPSGALLPEVSLLAATAPAQANVFLAPDGQLRYAFPALPYDGTFYPSLAVEAVRLFLGLKPSDMLFDLGRRLEIGELSAALDLQSRLVVNHYGPLETFGRVSLLDVLADEVPADRVRDRIVLIGATALGVGDRFATPFGVNTPGLVYFATVIDNLLHGRAVRSHVDVFTADLLAILVCGVLTAGLSFLTRPLTALFLGLGLFLAWCLVSHLAFVWGQLWLNFTFPAFTILANLALVTMALTLGQQTKAAWAGRREAALSRFVSPLVVQRLDRGEAAEDFDRVQTAAVLFVDLRDFTSRCELMPPHEALALLRGFHQRVEDAASANGGTIDKFLGDGALLIFGLAEANGDDAKAALTCALDLLGEIGAWSASLVREDKPVLEMGLGLHHGLISLGEIGGRRQSQVTVAGDTVNTASRLQALTRDLEASIVASDAFVARVKEQGGERLLKGFRRLPPQEIRGRREKIEIWAWTSNVEARTGPQGVQG